MSAFNSLLDYGVTAPAPAPPYDSNGNATAGASMGPAPAQTGVHIAALQGTPPLRGEHNIPLHVAFLGLLALGLVVALRYMGFRFSAVGKIGVGGG